MRPHAAAAVVTQYIAKLLGRKAVLAANIPALHASSAVRQGLITLSFGLSFNLSRLSPVVPEPTEGIPLHSSNRVRPTHLSNFTIFKMRELSCSEAEKKISVRPPAVSMAPAKGLSAATCAHSHASDAADNTPSAIRTPMNVSSLP